MIVHIYIHMIIYICTIFIIWVKLVKYQIVPKLDRFTEVIQLYAILTLRSDVSSNENHANHWQGKPEKNASSSSFSL